MTLHPDIALVGFAGKRQFIRVHKKTTELERLSSTLPHRSLDVIFEQPVVRCISSREVSAGPKRTFPPSDSASY